MAPSLPQHHPPPPLLQVPNRNKIGNLSTNTGIQDTYRRVHMVSYSKCEGTPAEPSVTNRALGYWYHVELIGLVTKVDAFSLP